MHANLIRFTLSCFAGLMFLFLANSFMFFSKLELTKEMNASIALILLCSFLPFFIAFLVSIESNTFVKTLLINSSYFIVGMFISQGIFIIFNDKIVSDKTTEAYNAIQTILNIKDGETYGAMQMQFLKDKEANDFKALSSYVENRLTYQVADTDKAANFIFNMNSNKDPMLQEHFDKILLDKVISVQELNDFSSFVVKYKLSTLK